MTNKVRFTYRLPETLMEQIKAEANSKGISINAVINSILFEYYYCEGGHSNECTGKELH